MNIVDAVTHYALILKKKEAIEDKKGKKNLKKEVKELRKSIREIKSISIDEVLKVDELRTNVEAYPYSSSDFWLLDCLREIEVLMEKNPEIIMDANAIRTCSNMNLPPPKESEILKFRIKLYGTPLPQKRSLRLHQRRDDIVITLPAIRFEGLAKLSSDLFYTDWIDGLTPKSRSYFFGPVLESYSPSIYPLSMISKLSVPSADSKFDFDFVITSPTEVNKEQLRGFWKRNGSHDYHPIHEFRICVKIEGLNGESKDSLNTKRRLVSERLKQSVGGSPKDVGWTMAYVRYLGYGFPEALRGSLVDPNSRLQFRSTFDRVLPISSDNYLLTVQEEFDVDNIIPQEGLIDDISVMSGSNIIGLSQRTFEVFPTLRTMEHMEFTFCITAIGKKEHVSLQDIQQFSKSFVRFAKDQLPKGKHVVAGAPLLLASEIDKEAREWVEKKTRSSYNAYIVPSLLDLKKGVLHYCTKVRGVRYHSIKMFIEKYLLTGGVAIRT